MNTSTQELAEKVNQKLSTKPLIYFCKDAERATGLEDIITNYFVACTDSGYIQSQLKEKIPTYCSSESVDSNHAKTTLELLQEKNLQDWVLQKSEGKGFYSQFFQFNNPSAIKVKDMGGIVLNNSTQLNRILEDKISQNKFFSDHNLNTPTSIITNISLTSYFNLKQDLGNEMVIQMDRSHTGMGTFFVDSEDTFKDIQNKLSGNVVKISKKIEGESYTVNGCVTQKGVYVAGLQYQITGIKELTSGKGSTVGNDFSYANKLSEDIKEKIYNLTQEIGEIIKGMGYIGLFGLDLVVEDKNVYLIEINARQTANIPLQTRLELKAGRTPLSLINLASFLEIEFNENLFENIYPLDGAQIFLRAKKDDITINHSLKSGIYRLQSDNAAIDWRTLQVKDNVILIDEDGDKPLVWQKDGYNVLSIDKNIGGFIILFQSKDIKKNISDEIVRMQFNNGIINNGSVTPWIIEALLAIENIII